MVKLNEKINLKNEDSIKKVIEYVGDGETMQNILEKIEMFAIFKGLSKASWDDKKEVMKFEIEIVKKDKKISFDFYQSVKFTDILMYEEQYTCEVYYNKKWQDPTLLNIKMKQEKKEQMDGFLYSILSCIKMDSFTPDNFSDFCLELGYNEDSIKDNILFNDCIEQKRKIKSLFSDVELEAMPN